MNTPWMPMAVLRALSMAALLLGLVVPVAADDDLRMPLSEAYKSSCVAQTPQADVVETLSPVSYDIAAEPVAFLSDSCGCKSCKKKPGKPNPCAKSHKGVFYANDFSYLNKPCYKGDCFGDCLKQNKLGCCGKYGTLDIGGQARLRWHNEHGMGQNAGQTRFQDTDNDFLLSRLRLYGNWQANDWVRVFVEGIVADVSGDDNYIARGIDRNYGDLLNAFVDVKLTDSLTGRIGRQELLYGAQRTVSPLDWANTRRTFEGVKLMYKEGDLSLDGFYTNFVPVTPGAFDEANYDVRFYGMYGVYSGMENKTLDFYYLGFDNDAAGSVTADFSLHTLGLRLAGKKGDWLYEFEGAPQFGSQSGLGTDQAAVFCTAGVGRKFHDTTWKPEVWFYYDYASGNDMGGDFNRYNQLFPLAHKYLGFIDATQRANIESPNLLVKLSPTKKLSVLLWYYHLMANQAADIVPSIGGTPAQSTTSKDWGDEIDFIAKYNLTPRSNILVGYSHFFAGNKILAPEDADFTYVQWTQNF